MKQKKCRYIARVEYNWFTTSESGEEYDIAEVVDRGVKRIDYHQPHGEGDRHYCDIHYADGTGARVFNLNRVVEKPIEPKAYDDSDAFADWEKG